MPIFIWYTLQQLYDYYQQIFYLSINDYLGGLDSTVVLISFYSTFQNSLANST